MKTTLSTRASPWPARMDIAQSLTGLFLAVFMWIHMFFVSSILLGKDVFWMVARFFEGYFFFGRAFPQLVSLLVIGIFAIIVLHAALALRKFPANTKQYYNLWQHTRGMQHYDTTLWVIQVATGFAMFFLAPVHIYMMMTRPDLIGPYGSADRVWTERMWPLYLMLLFAVELHGIVGLYRLALKWGWFQAATPALTRTRLQTFKWMFTAFFLGLGLLSLAAYIKIGIEHAPRAGEVYTPAWVVEAKP